MPELDFDSLSLDDDEDDLECDQNAQVAEKTETDHIEQEDEQDNSQDDKQEEEDLQASGDSEELNEKKVKEESEASTPDKAIYEALVCTKLFIYLSKNLFLGSEQR